MTPADIQYLIDRMDQVRARAAAALARAAREGNQVLATGCRETGALRRATLDLDEASLALRRPHQHDESMEAAVVHVEEDLEEEFAEEEAPELLTVEAGQPDAPCLACGRPVDRSGQGGYRKTCCSPECKAKNARAKAAKHQAERRARRKLEVAA